MANKTPALVTAEELHMARWRATHEGSHLWAPDFILRLAETIEEYQAALECIVHRWEQEDTGHGFPKRGGELSWAMHSDAEMALRGKFRQPD